MSAPAPTAHPAPAATVMLLRDEPAFEVLMVRRHHQIEFASGALVFPGGKVEPGDGDAGWLAHTTGDEDLTRRSGRFASARSGKPMRN